MLHAIPQPEATFELITPERAREWLDSGARNRNISDRRVNDLVRQIHDDQWQITPASIAFDWDGKMIDGQHRLSAIHKAGVPLWSFVVRGLCPDVIHFIDTGRVRMASDSLAIAGFANAAKLAAMAKVIILYGEGAYRHSSQQYVRHVSNAEVKGWCEVHPEAGDFIRDARWINQSFAVPSVATLAAVLHITDAIDSEDTAEMIARMRNKTLHGRGDPLFTLEKRFASAKGRREKLSVSGQLSMYFRVWNALRAGKPLAVLKIGQQGGAAGTLGDISVPDPK